MAYFELRTARDMLQKANREHHRLAECLDIDNLFNFFVTAYHISDYVRNTNAVPQVVLDTFLQDQDIKDCRDLCDKGKHLTLTKRADPTTHMWSGCLNGAPLNTLPLNGGGKWVLLTGNREVDVKWLSERVLSKWEVFFSTNSI
ncbi:hypothetical protein [Thermithiobacillus plumbiphilus]|uniref:Uncharacterized protein n=1 Tax=Thermithiobacillus plumbiphilus TaxID=1729899 RepID=A0ABU9D524_9PROT